MFVCKLVITEMKTVTFDETRHLITFVTQSTRSVIMHHNNVLLKLFTCLAGYMLV